MDSSNAMQKRNQELANAINQVARDDPHSRYAGKFVGIANGQLVIVADSLDEVVKYLRQTEPDPQKTFCIEAGVDYKVVECVWAGTNIACSLVANSR